MGLLSKMRQLMASPFGAEPRVSPNFHSNQLRWFKQTDTKIASEIRSILGSFSPKTVGLTERLMMRDDPDVALGLALVRAPIVNLQWTIESEGNDQEVSAFVEAVLKPVYRQLALGGSLALFFGNQVVSKEWTVVDRLDVVVTDADGKKETKSYPNALVYGRFKAIHPRTITLLIDPEKDDWGGVEQTQNGKQVRVGPEGAVFWSFNRQDVWGDLRGYPFSNKAYDPWYTMNAIRFMRNRYYERRAEPNWKGRAAPSVRQGGVDVDGFAFMHEQLAATKSGNPLVMPNARDQQGQYLFDAEFISDDKRGDMFQLAIDAESVKILRAFLITDKAATSDGTGALAMASQHAETMATMFDGILREWTDEVINKQVITPLVELNFGPERVRAAGARMTGAGISSELKGIFKELILQLLQSEQLQQDGTKVKISERIDGVAIAQQLGVPLFSEDEVRDNAGGAGGKIKATDGGDPDEPDPVVDQLIPPGETPPAIDPNGDPNAMPTKQDVLVTTDAFLNGAQISSAVDIVRSVVAGEIPEDAGLAMIEILFNLSSDQAKKIIGSAATAAKKKAEETAKAAEAEAAAAKAAAGSGQPGAGPGGQPMPMKTKDMMPSGDGPPRP